MKVSRRTWLISNAMKLHRTLPNLPRNEGGFLPPPPSELISSPRTQHNLKPLTALRAGARVSCVSTIRLQAPLLQSSLIYLRLSKAEGE